MFKRQESKSQPEPKFAEPGEVKYVQVAVGRNGQPVMGRVSTRDEVAGKRLVQVTGRRKSKDK